MPLCPVLRSRTGCSAAIPAYGRTGDWIMAMVQAYPVAQEDQPLQQGIITVLFEKDFRGVRPALLNVNKEYHEIIHTSFSAQMEGELAVEIILVRGDTSRIRSLERALVGKRGVRSVRLTMIPS